MKTNRGTFIICVLLMAVSSAAADTNDPNATLQRGLFEEEANHNLDAAIQAYQSVVNQYDEDRKLAATAIFRLGESYRKQGKTNEAIVQYERVLREFGDQSELVAASRSLLPASSQSQVSEGTKAPPAGSTTAEEVSRIQALIKESPDLINSSDSTGETLLQKAASKGESAVVKLLLDSGAAVDGPKQPGLTALHYAAGNGHKAVVDLLLGRGANVDARSEGGVTPLHLAALKGYGLVAKTLLDTGASVNARAEKDVDWSGDVSYSLRAGQTPLHAAAESGYSAMAELLLSKGADVNVQDAKGRTPLSYAAERRDATMAKTLLAAHADPDAGRANLPLQYAAWNGDVGLLELLLTKGANPNTNSFVNWSVVLPYVQNWPQGGSFPPLFLAISQRHTEAVRLLVRYKADPNGTDNSGNPLLFDALSDLETLKALLEGGADASAHDSSGVSALAREIEAGNPSGAQLLLAHGASVNATNPSGGTPLHLAASRGAKDIAELLLKKGADVNARTQEGDTPLHVAVGNSRQELVELLLTNKADPNARNNAGITPLKMAVLDAHSPFQARVEFGVPPVGTAFRSGVSYPPPTVSAVPTRPSSPAGIAELLRRHGALEDVPRPEAIQVRRPGGYSDSGALLKGTNNWNQFTVLEVLAMEYSLLTKVPSGEERQQLRLQLWVQRYSLLAFPNLEAVRIRRLASDLKSWQDEMVDLSLALSAGDCSKDVPVKWGDVLEIPEADHPLNETWLGFSTNEWANLKKCLSRQVEIIVKGRSTKVTLAPEIPTNAFPGFAEGTMIMTRVAFWIKPALRQSNALLASSDLSRVKVTRRDPKTATMREWVLDCSDSQPAPDFWLRDGDVIEVPDKS